MENRFAEVEYNLGRELTVRERSMLELWSEIFKRQLEKPHPPAHDPGISAPTR
jgi:hypothetical protein